MAFTKYASLEVSRILDVKGSAERDESASLSKVASFNDYRTEDGYLYARIRAISSRVNKNHDGWPSVELAGGQEVFDHHTANSSGGFTVSANSNDEYGFSTFIGKPIFVDHHNSDPSRARGVIVDSKLHVEDYKTAAQKDSYYHDAPSNHTPPTWVELLLEVDAKSFPKLAKAIIAGSKNAKDGIDGFSMGCDVERSVCNICKNSATTPDEFCKHVMMKGASFDHYDEMGHRTSKKAYEDCYGIKFFEISAVFDPADETALIREVRSNVKEASMNKTANDKPQSFKTRAPEDVDTLREDHPCEVCGETMDGPQCDVCGYEEEPKGFDNPDLSAAKERKDSEEQDQEQDEELTSVDVDTINSPVVAHVNDTEWIVSNPRIAQINKTEKPILPVQSPPATNEPKDYVVKDQKKPITSSSVRTASDFLAVAGNRKRNNMEQHIADAEMSAPAVAKPDYNVNVVETGGVGGASNEQASKADAQVNVTDIGGVSGVGIGDEKTVEVTQGDEHSKNIEAIHTDTFGPSQGDSLGQQDPVTNDTFPNKNEGVKATSSWVVSDVKGTEPADAVGRPDERIDVSNGNAHSITTEDSGPTKTWTGTEGNGVTRQQDPVTPTSSDEDQNSTEVHPTGVTDKDYAFGDKSAHLMTAFKLADTEIELGLLDASQKYARIAELEKAAPSVVEASLDYANRVKTAGLKKSARTTRRLPSLVKGASTTASSSTPEEPEDSALFM